MSKKRNFFPSERRKQRRLKAMGERQLAGEVWKYPGESWRAGWVRMAFREFDEVLNVILHSPLLKRETSKSSERWR